MSYAKNIPVDKNRTAMEGYPPPYAALVTTTFENVATSSAFGFNDNTTVIEVTAVGGTGYIKWVGLNASTSSILTAQGTANYDHTVPSGTTRKFVVPVDPARTKPASIVGENIRNGLYRQMAVRTTGNASVLTTEY